MANINGSSFKRNNNPKIYTGGGGGRDYVQRADVVSLTPDEMTFFVTFHRIAQKYDLGIHCSQCGQALQGDNTGHESYFTVRCNCRELKGERPRNT